eukprot:466198-Prorocentrum_minimum.AAC.15
MDREHSFVLMVGFVMIVSLFEPVLHRALLRRFDEQKVLRQRLVQIPVRRKRLKYRRERGRASGRHEVPERVPELARVRRRDDVHPLAGLRDVVVLRVDDPVLHGVPAPTKSRLDVPPHLAVVDAQQVRHVFEKHVRRTLLVDDPKYALDDVPRVVVGRVLFAGHAVRLTREPGAQNVDFWKLRYGEFGQVCGVDGDPEVEFVRLADVGVRVARVHAPEPRGFALAVQRLERQVEGAEPATQVRVAHHLLRH